MAAPALLPAVSELCKNQAIPVGTTIEWLLGACRPDVIVVATPTDTHARLVAEAAVAMCHAFCEKPLCSTPPKPLAAFPVPRGGGNASVGHPVVLLPGRRPHR